MCKLKAFTVAILFTGLCQAQNVIPTTPNTNGTGSSVRSKDGVQCTQGTKSTPIVDFGVSTFTQPNYYAVQPQQNNQSVYARIVIPLGNESPSVDCLELYQLEIERMRIELDKLRSGQNTEIIVR